MENTDLKTIEKEIAEVVQSLYGPTDRNSYFFARDKTPEEVESEIYKEMKKLGKEKMFNPLHISILKIENDVFIKI